MKNSSPAIHVIKQIYFLFSFIFQEQKIYHNVPEKIFNFHTTVFMHIFY